MSLKYRVKRRFLKLKTRLISYFKAIVGKLPATEEKYFKRGDLVETKTGEEGRVWRVYKNRMTDKVEACTVIWYTPYKGENYTLLLPAEDRGKKFNPVIRKVE